MSSPPSGHSGKYSPPHSSFTPIQLASAEEETSSIGQTKNKSSMLEDVLKPEALHAPPNSNAQSKQHYSNVKMKYFHSLGVQQPSIPNTQTHQQQQQQQQQQHRNRTRTTPALPEQVMQLVEEEESNNIRPDSPTRNKRSSSMPVPVQHSRISPPTAIPMPNSRRPRHIEDSDSDEDSPGGRKFMPPHEMMMSQSFQVGTAKDVAIWDRQRRRNLND